eukprot:COSAG01_NODE_1024_length_12058_cov_91.598211_3_plen_52_part_00
MHGAALARGREETPGAEGGGKLRARGGGRFGGWWLISGRGVEGVRGGAVGG